MSIYFLLLYRLAFSYFGIALTGMRTRLRLGFGSSLMGVVSATDTCGSTGLLAVSAFALGCAGVVGFGSFTVVSIKSDVRSSMMLGSTRKWVSYSSLFKMRRRFLTMLTLYSLPLVRRTRLPRCQSMLLYCSCVIMVLVMPSLSPRGGCQRT